MKFLKIEKTIFVCQACYERFSRDEASDVISEGANPQATQVISALKG